MNFMVSKKSDNFCDVEESLHMAPFHDFYEDSRIIYLPRSYYHFKNLHLVKDSLRFTK